jgi:hypothetical protein
MTDDQHTPARMRGVFTATLTDEPTLTDMVSGAVAGARARKRRDRIAFAATPLAIVGLAAGGYALAPASGHAAKDGGAAVGAGAGKAPTTSTNPTNPTTATTKPTSGIPALKDPFANPGPPEKSCQGNYFSAAAASRSAASQEAECVANLTALRALLPDDVVVADHEFVPTSPEVMERMTTLFHDSPAPGTKVTDLATTVIDAENDPKSPDNFVAPTQFLVKTPTGVAIMKLDVAAGPSTSGTGTCVNGKSGGTSSKPCGAATLADGSVGDFVSYPTGGIQVVVDNFHGNQVWFSINPDDHQAYGTRYSDGHDGKWIDLTAGVLRQGDRVVTNPYTKDTMLSLTGSQGFLNLVNQVVKTETGH